MLMTKKVLGSLHHFCDPDASIRSYTAHEKALFGGFTVRTSWSPCAKKYILRMLPRLKPCKISSIQKSP